MVLINEKMTSIDIQIKELKNNLCIAKSELDFIPHVKLITNALDPFRTEKYKIAKKIGEKNISNAWLKCFEIIMKFDMMKSKKHVRHFDNAAFPGAFILATEYIMKNHYPKCNYVWRACSLYDKNKPHLEDSYKLYEKFPDKWLMDSKNNGDVTSLDNINYIAQKLDNKTNFYTSDIGFDVSSDYNNQEVLHFDVNTGQILLCLKVLQENGCCIIKHFTYFEDYTLQYLDQFSKLFEKFYFHKPLTSKALNSEIYLIGVNFLKNSKENSATYQNLMETLEKCLVEKTFFIDKEYPYKFVGNLLNTIKSLTKKQINELKKVSNISNKVKKIVLEEKENAADISYLREIIEYVIKKNKYKQTPRIVYHESKKLLRFNLN
jgi:hypothetical protein